MHEGLRYLLCALTGLCVLSSGAVDVGAGWRIVIPDPGADGVQGVVRRLSADFAASLRESTGLDLQICTASKDSRAGHAIYIGGDFAEKAGVMPSDMNGWSNGIAEKGGNLYFFGRDRAGRKWKPGEYPNAKLMVLPSVRAMTRFMYKFMGVRFVMPDVNGTAVPKLAKLTVPDGYADREDPEFDFMAGSTFFNLPGIGRGQFGCGLYHTYGGHTYPVAVPYAVYSKDHPEYFALTREGKRSWGPTGGATALCISNPEVEELIVAEMLRRYDDGALVCQLAQHDGSNHCWCRKCQAMYGTEDWCEKTWLFHKHIAERIEKLRPGKIVHIICYDLTHDPPKTFRKFPSNVMVELCKYSDETFAEWQKYDVPHGFTVYIYLWGNYPPPGFTPKRSFAGISTLVKRLRANRVHGVYRCGFGELPGIEGAQYYYFDRLLQDPSAQMDSTLKEFCDAAFGPVAGEPMKRFYETLDERLRMFDSMSMGHFEAEGPDVSKYLKAVPSRTLDLLAYFYTPETLNVMEGCLGRAEAVKTLTEKERIRLQRVRVEFDYARNLGRIAVLYAGYKAAPSKESFMPLAHELKWRRRFLDRVFDEKGAARKLKDWPATPLFGGDNRAMVQVNGRLGAFIGDPLNWDVDTMIAEEYYPGSPGEVKKWKEYNAVHKPKMMTRFRPYPKELKVELDVRADGSGFRAATVPGERNTRIVAADTPKTGKLKPNTRYRVSWFARYSDVTPPTRKEGGFCVLIQCGPGMAFSEPAISAGLTGSSDWRHMSKTFRTGEKPWDACEVIFRLYDSQGSLEVEDVTIEELPDDKGK